MAEDPDLFLPVYSPRRCYFILHHWEEYETLTDSPKTAAHLADHLQREWTILQSEPGICLCGVARWAEGACAHSPGSSGGRSGSGYSASMILADMVTAANGLPIAWAGTRRVYEQQLRLGEWNFRYAVSIGRAGMKVDRLQLDAAKSYVVAVETMARTLGWTAGSDRHLAAAGPT